MKLIPYDQIWQIQWDCYRTLNEVLYPSSVIKQVTSSNDPKSKKKETENQYGVYFATVHRLLVYFIHSHLLNVMRPSRLSTLTCCCFFFGVFLSSNRHFFFQFLLDFVLATMTGVKFKPRPVLAQQFVQFSWLLVFAKQWPL